MGTYTTNKNLFMPTVGEQGWGTLVNGNFETIDNFLKPISLSGSTYTFTGSHVGNQSGGSVSATSISNNGTLIQTGTSTFTGKITGNGGIGTTSLTTSSTITSTGKITGNGGIGTTSLTTSSTITSTGLITANGGIKTPTITVPTKTSGIIAISLERNVTRTTTGTFTIYNASNGVFRFYGNPTITIEAEVVGYGQSFTATVSNGSTVLTTINCKTVTRTEYYSGTFDASKNITINVTQITNRSYIYSSGVFYI